MDGNAASSSDDLGKRPTASSAYKMAKRQTKACCYVYLVQAASGVLKIGMSNNPKHRLDGLRTSAHEKLSLGQTWRLADRDEAARLEQDLHRLFKPLRKAREWFDLEPREVTSVCQALLAGDADRAGRLAEAINAYRAASVIQAGLLARHRRLNPRWYKAERDEVSAELDKADAAHDVAYRQAGALGLEPNDWDDWVTAHPWAES